MNFGQHSFREFRDESRRLFSFSLVHTYFPSINISLESLLASSPWLFLIFTLAITPNYSSNNISFHKSLPRKSLLEILNQSSLIPTLSPCFSLSITRQIYSPRKIYFPVFSKKTLPWFSPCHVIFMKLLFPFMNSIQLIYSKNLKIEAF